MKKIIYGALATITGLVLLFSYRTSLGQAVPETAAQGAASTGTSTSDATGSSNGTGSSTGSSSSTLADGSYTGQAADTRFGPVQVQITVSGGAITDVTVPEYPNGNGRDQQINSYAIPQLISETVSAQNAHIDMVSGATYTSQGYLQSLQSALDQATS